MATEIYKKDLYGIIGVPEEATEKEILRGYRKKALQCHPDKNPDNPKAAELFHELSRALEILTDIAARAAYDQSLKAKKVAAERTRVLDSKRKKFKEDLEARERAAFEIRQADAAAEAERKLQIEIKRLRKEGSRLLEQEQERLRRELQRSSLNDNLQPNNQSSEPQRIKLKWKAQKGDPSNGGYSSDILKDILGCYGHINTLLVSSKRTGSAVVEFDGVSADISDEKGHEDNPFTIVWLSGKPDCPDEFDDLDNCDFTNGASKKNDISSTCSVKFDSGSSVPPVSGPAYSDDGVKDFESLVLMRMRQAEERKKLTEQMMKDDAE